ncbi:MAG TPA: PQQ-binding-like beta-propeller repeat protein [Verrucomicrobiae bacterium]
MSARLLVVALGISVVLPVGGENWDQWRGPFFNGSTVETNLPIAWSQTENVVWSAPLPGYSGATPIIWEDSVFVSSPDSEKNLLLLCLERKTGKVRWAKPVSKGDRDIGRNNMASPSPVTDGRSVFALFATGTLAAFDFSGTELWRRDLGADYGQFANMWIYGSSPMLYRDKLYVQVLQRSPVPSGYGHVQDGKPERESYLLCLDPGTGKTLWRHIRPTDALEESMEAYSTPIPYAGKAGAEILVVGANFVTAHDAATGSELWRCGGLNDRGQRSWRVVPSVVVSDGLVFACGPKRDPLIAIKDGGKGVVTEIHVAWRFSEFPSDCVTPLVYRGKLFVLDGDRQVLTCLEPATGEKKWQGNLGVREVFRASPTGADGKIYCVSEKGTVVVLTAGEEFKILSTIPMGEAPVRASIAVAQGELFVRTAKNLYCIRGE